MIDNDFIDSQRQIDDLLKNGIPAAQISEEDSALALFLLCLSSISIKFSLLF